MRGAEITAGERGEVFFSEDGGKVQAMLYYRNGAGARRRLKASAKTKTAARRAVLAAYDRLASAPSGGSYSGRTTIKDVAEEWLQSVWEMVDVGRRSPSTASLYAWALESVVLPAVGGLRLVDVDAVRLDHAIHDIRRRRGHANAKLARSILSGVCGHAVRRGGLRSNPVRDVASLEGGRRKEPRALTPEEQAEWLAILDADAFARSKELPDVARFLLGTGCRIGEALGATWEDFNVAAGILHVRRTVVRVKGQGLVVKEPKTRSGERLLHLPVQLVELLITRRERLGAVGPIFPDVLGGHRDVNNVEAAFRRVRAGTPFTWVVPHSYRKTVATTLDRAGLSARTIADQLGHSRVSLTQDVYMGRRVVDSAAAAALGVPEGAAGSAKS